MWVAINYFNKRLYFDYVEHHNNIFYGYATKFYNNHVAIVVW